MEKLSPNTDYLDDLSQRLGHEKTVQMIEFSMPYVDKREQELHEALQLNDWQAASHCAHKAISSVRLFGSPRLESLLVQVRDGLNEQDTTWIRAELSEAFSAARSTVNAWLAKHQPCL